MKPDFEKAAREYNMFYCLNNETSYWMGIEIKSPEDHFLAGCEHAYSIDKETIERLENENKRLQAVEIELASKCLKLGEQQKLVHDYLIALNDYHKTIKGQTLHWDKSLADKAEKAGDKYAESLTPDN